MIAQGTEDLEADREQLVSYLDQCGIPNLPTDFYPQGSADFKAAVEQDLARSDLFVQLLGRTSGRRPRDMPEGYLVAQYQLAEAAGRKILQWRSPDLVPDDVADEAHRAFLFGEKVAAIGFESFKAQIRKLATELPPKAEPVVEDFDDAPDDIGRHGGRCGRRRDRANAGPLRPGDIRGHDQARDLPRRHASGFDAGGNVMPDGPGR